METSKLLKSLRRYMGYNTLLLLGASGLKKKTLDVLLTLILSHIMTDIYKNNSENLFSQYGYRYVAAGIQ